MLLDDEMMTGDFDKNLELWNTLQWGVCTDEFTEKALKVLVADYIRIDLITAMDDDGKVMEMVWNPLAPESK